MKESLVEAEVRRSSRIAELLSTEESNKAKKTPPYLSTVPVAVIKFSHAPKNKKKERRVVKKPQHKVPAEEVEGPFGFGFCVFRCCQRFNNIRSYMVVYCILVISHGMSLSLKSLSVKNFERNYEVKGIEKIAMNFTYDISAALVAAFVGFYGIKANRPKWMAVSALFIGLGSFMMAFPFLSEKHIRLEGAIEDMCDMKKHNIPCLKRGTYERKYLTLFIIGQALHGIAGMPLYILGITYIDDNAPTRSSATYLGYADVTPILGYGIAYVIGAPLTKAMENNTSGKQHTNDEDSGKKQKMWSLDFIFSSALAFSTLIPILCFPQNLPGSAKLRAWKRKQSNLFVNKFKDRIFENNVKDFCYANWILLKNPVFLCQVVCRVLEFVTLLGASGILPLYLENQFLVPPRLSSVLTGIIVVPANAIGIILGGVIVSKLKMSCKAIMRFTIITSSISLILLGSLNFVQCDSVKIAGITENYDGTGQLGNLTAPCNAHCGCSSSLLFSICGRDDKEYFSPCFAGCILVKKIHKRKAYYHCSCIKSGLTTADEDNDFIDARPGKCNMNCHSLPLFFSFIFCATIFSSFCIVPLKLITFNVTPEKLHSLAIGLTYVFVRVVGTIPAPIIFKLYTDKACIFREINKCGHKGRCWFYNKAKMADLMVGLYIFCKGFTVLFSVIGFYIYKYMTRKNTDVQPVPIKTEKPKIVQKSKF